MELIKVKFNENKIPDGITACIGEFDGVHIAHQKLIEKTIQIGDEYNLKKGIITFEPHPDYVLNKNKEEKYITLLDEKIKYIEQNFNIDYFILIDFNLQLASLTYEKFFEMYLKNIKYLIVGYDFKFGKYGEGNIEKLKQIHNNVIVIDQINYENKKISSSLITNYLKNGNINLVNMLLGRPFSVVGTVSEGSKIGSSIGFPTANIWIDKKYCDIKKGVYACYGIIDNKKYLGICNYGVNPSFNKINSPRLETHFFDFDQNLYGKIIKIELIDFIREEAKFQSIDEFLIQLKKDINICKEKFGG